MKYNVAIRTSKQRMRLNKAKCTRESSAPRMENTHPTIRAACQSSEQDVPLLKGRFGLRLLAIRQNTDAAVGVMPQVLSVAPIRSSTTLFTPEGRRIQTASSSIAGPPPATPR